MWRKLVSERTTVSPERPGDERLEQGGEAPSYRAPVLHEIGTMKLMRSNSSGVKQDSLMGGYYD